GKTRECALSLCEELGASFTGLTSSWAPFLVATASLLRPGGRMAFVVPAEIGHAPHAPPLLGYGCAHFSSVQIVAIRDKLFPELSEDCWLLYAEGYGNSTSELGFTALDKFEATTEPPRVRLHVSVAEWRFLWKQRLRPFLLPERARQLYHLV